MIRRLGFRSAISKVPLWQYFFKLYDCLYFLFTLSQNDDKGDAQSEKSNPGGSTNNSASDRLKSAGRERKDQLLFELNQRLQETQQELQSLSRKLKLSV